MKAESIWLRVSLVPVATVCRQSLARKLANLTFLWLVLQVTAPSGLRLMS